MCLKPILEVEEHSRKERSEITDIISDSLWHSLQNRIDSYFLPSIFITNIVKKAPTAENESLKNCFEIDINDIILDPLSPLSSFF